MSRVIIGKQIWAEKNLSVKSFRNGDEIRKVESNEEWKKCDQEGVPAYCTYANEDLEQEFGCLYNQHAVNDARGLAPEGTRIPEKDDWNQLFEAIDPGQWGVEPIQKHLKSKEGWDQGGNGLDTHNLNIKAGGFRSWDGGFFDKNYDENDNLVDFTRIGQITYFWSKTLDGSSNWTFHFRHDQEKEVGKARMDGGFYVRTLLEA